MAGRALIVGDVHGCRAELEELLDTARFDPSCDELVMTGDLVAKGPDSRGVLTLLRSLGAQGVRGNHDERCISWYRAVAAGDAPPKLKKDHRRTSESLDTQDWEQLQSYPLWLELPDHNAVVVHAGLVPGKSLKEQDPEHLMCMRSIRPNGTVTRRVEPNPWATTWQGPRHVYFGHDAIRGLQKHAFATGLDTGCVYGGRLTAAVLSETGMELVSVAAHQAWRPIEQAGDQ